MLRFLNASLIKFCIFSSILFCPSASLTPLIPPPCPQVTSMDHAIGTVLTALETLGIEKNTLVVFTSDNGPEFVTRGGNAGGTGGLRGAKRALYEGGVRVPAIFQWVGTIPAGRSDAFGMSTDLYPTFADAAGVRAPSQVRLWPAWHIKWPACSHIQAHQPLSCAPAGAVGRRLAVAGAVGQLRAPAHTAQGTETPGGAGRDVDERF